MQAEFMRRRLAQGLVAAMFASLLVVAGPAAPKAQAIPNPCNMPGGRTVCEKVEDGAKWLYDKSGADSVVEGVTEAIDFASDPLGYLEQKLRSGTKSMFGAFGEELTGKNPNEPKKKPKKVEGD
ncbi:hypothetical protein K388_05992 [Streptomyces sp. KhCrAH-43]|uniref:hypothetical protein n=1 Tax=unclassified Streptomyces TaxID=2593676 RepID=UPI000360F8A3|nr:MULTISPECIES: hypothetical protein [unclassified Streptomyces]MYS33650.1 hypothetical protein [Streptomyces sp. SID4920]MYX63757.1 hypothetical protein [Streptomyces sp. SID8373]RAJ52892.1 hypothetical protein K388_05992 [Streptomyces sp. KhCrAH-43]